MLGIVALFMHLQKRNRAEWNAEEAVVADRAGAYRSSQKAVGIVERIRDIPSEVQVAAILALFFGVVWVPSIPIVGVGIMFELDGSWGMPGLATLFGTTGIPLSIAHFVLGIRFTKRDASARSLARGVAAWSIVHNVLLFLFVFAMNLGGYHEKALETVNLEHELGFVPLLYGCISIVYAVCKNIDGHTYHLYIIVCGEPLDQQDHPKNGMVMDFSVLKKIVQENITDVFDHALVLNANSPHKNIPAINQHFEKE